MNTRATPAVRSPKLGNALLHPFYVLRVAGEPADITVGLEDGDCAKLLAACFELRDRCSADAEAMCKLIEPVVPDLDDKPQSRAALKLKRALYNLRPSDLAATEFLSAHIEDFDRIRRFNDDLERITALEGRIAEAYERDMASAAERLPALIGRHNLMAGISYTNPDLFEQLRDRLQPDAEKPATGKTRRNLEESLLQYATRSSTKTSPLSSFTVMQVGRWDDTSTSGSLDVESDGRLTRRLAFKGALMQGILAPLIDDFGIAARLFPLRINPSARTEADQVRFRAVTPGNLASGRFWGTGEALSGMKRSSVVRVIEHVFAQAQGEELTAQALCYAVCRLAPKLAAEQVWSFLARLYEVQFLQAETGLFGQDDVLDWAEAVIARLHGIDPDRAQRGSELLATIRAETERLRVEDPDQRADAVHRIGDAVAAFAGLFGVEPHKTLARPNVFENCYLDATPLPASALAPYADDLDLLTRASQLLDFTHQARNHMADFYLATYGAEGVCDDPAEFLDRFDEIYGIGVVGHQIDGATAAPPSPVTTAIDEAARQLTDYLEPRLRRADASVSLDRVELGRILGLLPPQIRHRSISQCYLAQFATEDGRRKMVVNQVFGGRSSVMSRFLEALDEGGLDDVRAHLAEGSDVGRVAELAGVFGFNANRHPRTIDDEVTIAPYPHNRRDSRHHDLGALRLVYDAAAHTVRLDTAGGRLDLFYQGLLIPTLLPRLQRVLALCFTEGPSIFAFNALIERNIINPAAFSKVPRLTLGDVVVARRMWIVPNAELPDADLAPYHFFRAVQDWRRERGLPNEVFARVLPIAGGEATEEIAALDWNTVDFKDMKPFHVRFDSPRLVRLMQRMVKRNRFSLSMTEVLPKLDDQHVEVAGERHVAELQFEMTKPATFGLPEPKRLFTIRIAYFAEDRRGLILGPVHDAVAMLRERFGITDVSLQSHWKHGPHLDLTLRADPAVVATQILPAVRAVVLPWMQAHPSRRALDPAAYEALSQKIGLSELEPGPYLPMLEDNTVTLAPYRAGQALKLPELAERKQRFLARALDLTLDLLAAADEDRAAVMLTLLAMMAVAGETYRPHGLSRGFMSFRSHAEYFFAAYDTDGRQRARFDALDRRHAGTVEGIVRAVLSGKPAEIPLPDRFRRIVSAWGEAVAATAAENAEIVEVNHAALVHDTTFASLVEDVSDNGTSAYRQRLGSRRVSAVGEAFEQDEGVRLRETPEFLTYRTTVNFFYLLLPVLGISPAQRFCLCHMLANASERVLGITWQQIMGVDAPEASR